MHIYAPALGRARRVKLPERRDGPSEGKLQVKRGAQSSHSLVLSRSTCLCVADGFDSSVQLRQEVGQGVEGGHNPSRQHVLACLWKKSALSPDGLKQQFVLEKVKISTQ